MLWKKKRKHYSAQPPFFKPFHIERNVLLCDARHRKRQRWILSIVVKSVHLRNNRQENELINWKVQLKPWMLQIFTPPFSIKQERLASADRHAASNIKKSIKVAIRKTRIAQSSFFILILNWENTFENCGSEFKEACQNEGLKLLAKQKVKF